MRMVGRLDSTAPVHNLQLVALDVALDECDGALLGPHDVIEAADRHSGPGTDLPLPPPGRDQGGHLVDHPVGDVGHVERCVSRLVLERDAVDL